MPSSALKEDTREHATKAKQRTAGARSVFIFTSRQNYSFPFFTVAADLWVKRPATPTISSRTNIKPKAVIVVQRAEDIPSPSSRSSAGAKFSCLTQSSLKFRNAATTPTSEPPAMYPEQSNTPGLDSDSSALGGFSLSTIQRIMPPTKIGNEVWIGR